MIVQVSRDVSFGSLADEVHELALKDGPLSVGVCFSHWPESSEILGAFGDDASRSGPHSVELFDGSTVRLVYLDGSVGQRNRYIGLRFDVLVMRKADEMDVTDLGMILTRLRVCRSGLPWYLPALFATYAGDYGGIYRKLGEVFSMGRSAGLGETVAAFQGMCGDS